MEHGFRIEMDGIEGTGRSLASALADAIDTLCIDADDVGTTYSFTIIQHGDDES